MTTSEYNAALKELGLSVYASAESASHQPKPVSALFVWRTSRGTARCEPSAAFASTFQCTQEATAGTERRDQSHRIGHGAPFHCQERHPPPNPRRTQA